MIYQRSDVACSKCGRSWLTEIEAPHWSGTDKELIKHNKNKGRRWNECYCGRNLYL